MAPSGYMLWVKDNRPSLAEELRRDPRWKDAGYREFWGELQSVISKKWAELDIEVKDKYEATAAAEKAAKKPVDATAAAEKVAKKSVDTTAAAENVAKKSADTSRWKELQALRAQLQLPAADLPSAAHQLFLQDAVERARIFVESLGEENVMAKMQEQWTNMPAEQKKAWESKAQVSKLHEWEQSAEGLELKKLEEEKRISDAAHAVAFQRSAVPAKRFRGKGGVKGRVKGSGRGWGRGGRGQREPGITDVATSVSSAPDVLSTPKKKRLREEPSTESVSTPPGPAAPQQHDREEVDLKSVGLDDDLLKRARRKGLEAPLVLLAQRTEIRTLGLPGSELFEAIRKSGGLVNAAKNSILSARCSIP